VKLEITPYNRNWLDCYLNNLIAILMTRNAKYEQLIGYVSSRFEMPLPAAGKLTDEEYTSYRGAGAYLPHIRKGISEALLQRYLDSEEIAITPDTDIIGTVKGLLRDGRYCFVRVNRYYYPGCYDYMTQRLIHPSFIYGYDDDAQKLLLIEDYIQVGRFERYEISYNDFLIAYRSIEQEERFALAVSASEAEFEAPLELLKANIDAQLTDEEASDDHFVYYKGIGGIRRFREHFFEAIEGVTDVTTNVFNRVSTLVFYPDRNRMLIRDLRAAGLLDSGDGELLAGGFDDLYRLWGGIRAKILQYYMRDNKPDPQSYFTNVDASLRECEAERELLERLRKKLG
jgi:hypothetical protein